MEFCITYACAVIIIMLPKTTIIILLLHIRFFYKLLYFYASVHQYKLGELLLASVWGEATVCGISKLGVRSGSHLLTWWLD